MNNKAEAQDEQSIQQIYTTSDKVKDKTEDMDIIKQNSKKEQPKSNIYTEPEYGEPTEIYSYTK